MVSFLVVTHGELANALLSVAQMLGAQSDRVHTISLTEVEGPEEFYERVCQAIESLDDGDGVIALADLFGGTPFHAVFRAAQTYGVPVVTGVNLPMILSAIFDFDEEKDRDRIVRSLCETGKEQIQTYGKL